MPQTKGHVAGEPLQSILDQYAVIGGQENDITLFNYVIVWLNSVKQYLRPKTWLQYKRTLELHVLPQLGPTRLSELSPIQIQGLYISLQARGTGSRTIQLSHSILRNALNKAFQWGLIRANPVLAVDRPKVARIEMQTFSHQEARTFL